MNENQTTTQSDNLTPEQQSDLETWPRTLAVILSATEKLREEGIPGSVIQRVFKMFAELPDGGKNMCEKLSRDNEGRMGRTSTKMKAKTDGEQSERWLNLETEFTRFIESKRVLERYGPEIYFSVLLFSLRCCAEGFDMDWKELLSRHLADLETIWETMDKERQLH